jgi:hypothetical protein
MLKIKYCYGRKKLQEGSTSKIGDAIEFFLLFVFRGCSWSTMWQERKK